MSFIKSLIYENTREVKDIFYLMVLQGVTFLAPIVVFPYLMITLGAEKFGYISFSLSVCQYLTLIVEYGFNLSATKQVAIAQNNHSELNRIFSSTLYARLILLAITTFILLVISFIPQFAEYRSAMFVMYLIVISGAFSFVWLFQGLGNIRTVAIINAVTKISILPLTFVFVKSPDDYIIAALIQSLVCVSASLSSILIILHKKWVKLYKFIKEDVIDSLKNSFPIFLSIAATSVYTASFIIILGLFASPSEVGQYSAVEKIMRAACGLLLMPILQTFYPKISAMTKNRGEAISLVKKIFFIVISIMLLLMMAFLFGTKYLIYFLGSEYNESEKLFYIVSVIPLFVGMSGVLSQLVLLALGNEESKRKYRNAYIAAGFVAIISVLALTPHYHAIGTTVALLITECSVFLFMSYNVYKQKDIIHQ